MKRVISFLLAMVMLFGMLPMVATKAEAKEGLGEVEIEGGLRDFKWPVPGYYGLSSCFFDNRIAWMGQSKDHWAIDIATGGTKADVVAAYAGEIYKITYNGDGDGGYGNAVMLKHEYTTASGARMTLYSRYAHMDSISSEITNGKVKTVVAGETVLGKVGGSGYGRPDAYAIHLDFQILTNPNWEEREKYSIDPFANNLLELPSGIYKAGSYSCCQRYIDQVKELYKTPVSSYIKDNCTSYPAYGTITITKTCTPYTLPCNSDTAKKFNCTSNPITKNVPKVGDQVTVNGIVFNSEDHYWYKVTLSDGTSAWIYCKEAGDMKTKDPYVSGSILPDSISGSTALSGTIINGGAKLTMVQGVVYDAKGDIILPTDQIDISTTGNYTLKGSPVDNGLVFQNLQQYGNATYKLVIRVRRESYYLDSNYTIQKETKTMVEAGTDAFSFTTSGGSGGSGGSTTSSYTITFQPNGGTCSTSKLTVEAGDPIGTLPEPDFEEMNFVGWYTKPYGGTEVTASTVPTGNMELFAHYVNCSTASKLIFDPNGGALPGPVKSAALDGVNRGRPEKVLVVFNKNGNYDTNTAGAEIAVNSLGKIVGTRSIGEVTKLSIPSNGFILSGHAYWDSSAGVHVGGGVFVSDIIKSFKAGTDLYVSLDYETGVVKVFDSYAGYLNETKACRDYTTYGVLPVPVRSGYVFKGWSSGHSNLENYYSSYAGVNLLAYWDREDQLSPAATLTYNGHYYELYDYNVSWTRAKELCEAMGGHLVSITDSAEQAQMASLTAQGTRGLYRIGATDAVSEGAWKWVTGEAFSYNNWDLQAPEPNGGTSANYANIIAIENLPNKQVGEWIDDADVFYGNFYDLSNTGFICEYDTICNHSYQAVVTDSTCTDRGFTTHTCSLCGDSYVDTYVDAKGHDLSERSILDDANCESQGVAQIKCTRCDYSEMKLIEAYGHSYQAVVTAPTCTERGFTTHICSRCGDSYVDTYVDANGHSYKTAVTAPTCTEKGYTTHTCACGNSYVDSYVDAKGHSWDSGKVTTEATCTTTGVKTFTCSSCKQTKTETIAATGHSYKAVVTAPTCTEKGYTTHSCACGDSYVDTYVDAKGHSWDSGKVTTAATCTTAGVKTFACGSCKQTKTEAIAATGHSYKSVVTAPSCTEKGYTTHTCACGDKYVDTYVDAKGHSWDAGKVTTAATCTTAGVKIFMCGSCKQTKTEAIAATGHSHKAVVTAPTCTEKGYTTHTCACGDSYVDTYVNAKGHDYQNGSCFRCGVKDPSISSTVTGTCGKNLTWTLDGDGVLTISGTGEMTEFSTGTTEQPWSDYRNNIRHIIVEEGVTSIGKYAFCFCENLQTIKMADTVTAIGAVAFKGCTNLKNVDMGNGITIIDANAFADNTSLETITVGANVTHIEWSAFKNCTALKNVNLPDSLSYLGAEAFENCTSLQKIYLPKNLRIDTATASSEPFSAFRGCVNLTEIILSPESVALSIKDGVLYDKDKTILYMALPVALTGEFNVPNTVKTIYKQSFADCTGLTSIVFPAGLEYIKANPFENCKSLKEIKFLGDAPEFYLSAFWGLNATAYYPANNSTWTDSVMKDYNGTITWKSYSPCDAGHSNVSVKTEPTCTEDGYTTHTCSVCGDSYMDSYVDALGHAEVIDEAIAPSCMGIGKTEGKHCERCGEVLTAQEVIPALGHVEVVDAANPATCKTQGLTEGKHCDRCGDILVAQTVVEKLPHTEETIPAVESTCTQTGLTEGKKCSVCGDILVVQNTVAKADHVEVIDTAVAPTCTTTGLTEGKHCGNCGITLVFREVVPVLGHSEQTIPAVAPKCTETGLTEGMECSICGSVIVEQTVVPAAGHRWENGVCGSCNKVCEHEYSEETGSCTICGGACVHKYETVVKAPTCVEQGYTTHICTICGNHYIDAYADALGHQWKDATCTAPRTCSICGTTDGNSNGHNHQTVVTAPTCTEQGYTTHTCHCGDSYADSYTEPTGHVPGRAAEENRAEPTCTVAGGFDMVTRCTVCYVETNRVSTVIPATGHSYEAVVTPPICTEDGYTTYNCSACGDTYKNTPVDKLGHDLGDWVIMTDPTCTGTGLQRKGCSRCDYFKEEEIAANGHKHEAVVTAPTCTEDGYTSHTCSGCGDTYTDSFVAALDHELGDWVVTKEATCTETGLQRKDCSRCDYFEEEEISANSHAEVTDTAVAPTCTETGLTEGKHCETCGEVLIAQEVLPANGHSFEQCDEHIICSVCEEELIINLTQEYVVLTVGQTLELNVSPAEFANKVEWSIEDNEGVMIAEANVVKAEAVGTAHLRATITAGDFEYTIRFRVDVTEAVQLDGIQLSTNKVTTELYKDEFATFEILLDLPQNHPYDENELVISDDAVMAVAGLDKKSNLVDSVKFATINDLFTLEMLDDRTVQIIPTRKAMDNGKTLKSSYTDTVIVTVQGVEYPITEKLTLSVKKTSPKLKAKIGTFNSFYSEQAQEIVITGGEITGIRANEDKNTEKTVAIPAWLTLEDGSLKLNGETPKSSDKAYLWVDVDGWRVPAELTLSVKHSYKAPALKLSASSVTLNTLNGDKKDIQVTSSFADYVPEELEITSTAGDGLTIEKEGNGFTVSINDQTVSNKTYKVTVKTTNPKIKAVTLTVKTVGKNPTMNSLKVKGTMDINFPGNKATVGVTLKDYADVFVPTLTIKDSKDNDVTNQFNISDWNGTEFAVTPNGAVKGTYTATVTVKLDMGEEEITLAKTAKLTVKETLPKVKLSATKVTLNKKLDNSTEIDVISATKGYELEHGRVEITAPEQIEAVYVDGKLQISLNESAAYGKTYKVTIRAYKGASAATLSIAVPAEKKSNVSAAIKASGSIDVIREGTAITITPTFTNAFASDMETMGLKFYKRSGKVWADVTEEAPFYVAEEDGKYIVTAKEGLTHTDKYQAELVATVGGKEIVSKRINLSVKMGSAKLTIKSSDTTLFAKDRNDRAQVWFEAADLTLNGVESIEIKDAKYKDAFKIIDNRDGTFSIGFKDGKIHKNVANLLKKKASATITLNLNVFMEGNESTKANTTAKVKLTIVK